MVDLNARERRSAQSADGGSGQCCRARGGQALQLGDRQRAGLTSRQCSKLAGGQGVEGGARQSANLGAAQGLELGRRHAHPLIGTKAGQLGVGQRLFDGGRERQHLIRGHVAKGIYGQPAKLGRGQRDQCGRIHATQSGSR